MSAGKGPTTRSAATSVGDGTVSSSTTDWDQKFNVCLFLCEVEILADVDEFYQGIVKDQLLKYLSFKGKPSSSRKTLPGELPIPLYNCLLSTDVVREALRQMITEDSALHPSDAVIMAMKKKNFTPACCEVRSLSYML